MTSEALFSCATRQK